MIETRLLFLPALCLACTAYEPQPLPEWSAIAAPDLAADPATLSTAVARMLEHNERIVAALGTLHAARVRAAMPTPLANPEFSLGPVFLSGANALSRSHQAFEAALGWVLPLSGVRGATDALHSAEAQAAQVAAVVAAREEYLALRGELLELSVRVERAERTREVHQLLAQIAAQQRRLGRAGMGALDLHVIELEMHSAESAAGGIEAEVFVGHGAIARRCGVTPAAVAELPIKVRPELPAVVPSLPAVEQLLGEHPEVVTMRARYEVAEKDLHREVRRQYPDLSFGAGFEREEQVNRLVLPLGIELPIFDRNQGGIAVARARRQAVRESFASRVRALRGAVAVAHAGLTRQAARHQRLQERIDALVTSVRNDMQVLIRTGRLNATRRAWILRRVLEAQGAELDARADLYRAWMALESSCGAPLLRLPGEPAAAAVVEVK